jgi:transposase
MHRLKEDFRDIFESAKPWGDCITELLDWMHDALSYFPKALGTIV